MLWQSLRALFLAPGGPGSIWKYIGVPMRCTGVSMRFACGFQTDLHCADVVKFNIITRINNRWNIDGCIQIVVCKI
jgi:hypothetical protein